MSNYQKMMAASWQDIAYCLVLVERMTPNYALFAELSNFGDIKILRNALDVLWSEVAGHEASVDFAKQLEKLELVTPDTADYDSFGVRPASDACVALSLLLDVCALHETLRVADVESIDSSTIAAYLELIDYSDAEEHPLLLDASIFRLKVRAVLDAHHDRKGAVVELKALVRELVSSNIGIERA